ncbi:MAG: hypothetical protein DRJ01_12085 [Bacteroidetes bacterium]|nr:MAG: hypothetical protein DRJ01_12085 [Bacteroidota bacterium]
MKIILIPLIILLLSCSNRQNNSDKILQPEGRIKFITSYGFKETEKENETLKNTITSKATYSYDEKGNLIEVNYYDLKTNSVFSKDNRVYDDKGNMTEVIFYNRKGEVQGKDQYKYDDKNNQIQKDNYWKGEFNGKLTRTYNYKNMIVTEATFDKNENLQTKWSYKIDEKGNHIEEYDIDGNIISKSTIVYDDKGNIIKEHSQAWEMDTTNLVVDIQYDKYNNEVIRTITDLNNNNQVSTRKTEFVYDKYGNWTKMVVTWSWLPNRQTSKREIEYYD